MKAICMRPLLFPTALIIGLSMVSLTAEAEVYAFCSAHDTQTYAQTDAMLYITSPANLKTLVPKAWEKKLRDEEKVTPVQLRHGGWGEMESTCYGYATKEEFHVAYDKAYKVGRNTYKYGFITGFYFNNETLK